eukprot:scaffold10192_cov121-Skeletonema_dohrnii-CCMP3373.AAC.2
MYLETLQSSAPHGILPLANASWSSSRPAHQKFYGHSYTVPTPRIHFLQQFGLACTKAFAIHLRRPTRTQQVPRASSGTARAPPGLSSPFSTDPRVWHTGQVSEERGIYLSTVPPTSISRAATFATYQGVAVQVGRNQRCARSDLSSFYSCDMDRSEHMYARTIPGV